MKKILIIEDEQKISDMVKNYLEQEMFQVIMAGNGLSGLEKAKTANPDLIILDLMLPGLSGLDVCREIRKERNTPIIMLTAKSQEVDKLVGLELGADDYITKPFSLAELTARIKAVLRRAAHNSTVQPNPDVITRGELALDLAKVQLSRNGKDIPLTPTEFNLLSVLFRHPGRVFSRLQLLETALGDAYQGYERSIDTHISNLRRKIEDDPADPKYILTVYGMGYKFNENIK